MANTYSQIILQIVFPVKYRRPLLKKEWRDELFRYISGIITNKGHKSIIVNGVEDHIHILVGFRPVDSISNLVQAIKFNSTQFINSNNKTSQKFYWQEGYGVFSYSERDVPKVYNYIKNQEEHHRKTTLKEEYLKMLHDNNVTYQEKYLFDEK